MQPQTAGANPTDVDNYPNGGDADAPTWATGGTTDNIFVHQDGKARDFAIVYRLEGEDVWRCQDNT